MKPVRLVAALILSLILTVTALPVPPAAAQDDADTQLTPAEINRLEREIREKERRVRDFDNAIGKLKTGARQSSNSSLRKAVDSTLDLMAEAILFEERKFGEDNLIRMHNQYVTPVHSNELTKSRGVRTRRPYGPYGTQTIPVEYMRLVRMQEIIVTCRKMQELAVTRQGDAPQRFANVTLEFEQILIADLNELKSFLPEDTGPGYDSPYGINPDGSSKMKNEDDDEG